MGQAPYKAYYSAVACHPLTHLNPSACVVVAVQFGVPSRKILRVQRFEVQRGRRWASSRRVVGDWGFRVWL